MQGAPLAVRIRRRAFSLFLLMFSSIVMPHLLPFVPHLSHPLLPDIVAPSDGVHTPALPQGLADRTFGFLGDGIAFSTRRLPRRHVGEVASSATLCMTIARAAHTPSNCRGRDERFRPPPAQIRTCGIPAYGSYLGCLTANRCCGYGWRIRAGGSQWLHSRLNRDHVIRLV